MNSFLKKYAGQATAPDTPVPDKEQVEDFGAFGWMADPRQHAVMLELRRKDGNIAAFAYHLLEKVAFDPSEGIVLHFAIGQIRITGRNLNAEVGLGIRLFEQITRHRVAWIQAAAKPEAMRAGKMAAVIEKIEW